MSRKQFVFIFDGFPSPDLNVGLIHDGDRQFEFWVKPEGVLEEHAGQEGEVSETLIRHRIVKKLPAIIVVFTLESRIKKIVFHGCNSFIINSKRFEICVKHYIKGVSGR